MGGHKAQKRPVRIRDRADRLAMPDVCRIVQWELNEYGGYRNRVRIGPDGLDFSPIFQSSIQLQSSGDVDGSWRNVWYL